jgi:hypothetical protein
LADAGRFQQMQVEAEEFLRIAGFAGPGGDQVRAANRGGLAAFTSLANSAMSAATSAGGGASRSAFEPCLTPVLRPGFFGVRLRLALGEGGPPAA